MINTGRFVTNPNKDEVKPNPQVSVITVNYNGLVDTCELIDSLFNVISSVTFEIIVVDNASNVNEAEILQIKYPQIITIRSEKNLGFSGGNNLGILRARGEYLFFLNNDTFVISDGFKSLIDNIELRPEIVAASPKIIFADPGNIIQFAGYTPLSKLTLRNNSIGYGQLDDGRWDKPRLTPFLHGAAMIIKKSVIEKIGLMPEIYFLYYEELDWSAAVTRAGFEMMYIPYCKVYHKDSGTIGIESPLQAFYMTRNRLLYAWRNIPGMTKWFSILYLLLILNSKICFLFFVKRKASLAKACIKGILAFIKMKK